MSLISNIWCIFIVPSRREGVSAHNAQRIASKGEPVIHLIASQNINKMITVRHPLKHHVWEHYRSGVVVTKCVCVCG